MRVIQVTSLAIAATIVLLLPGSGPRAAEHPDQSPAVSHLPPAGVPASASRVSADSRVRQPQPAPHPGFELAPGPAGRAAGPGAVPYRQMAEHRRWVRDVEEGGPKRTPLVGASRATGAISGRITDSSTGVGLPGALVHIFDADGTFLFGQGTDSAGYYTTGIGLATGIYYVVSVNWLGYYDELYDNLPCTGGCNVTTGAPIAVTDGTTTSGINFALDPGGGNISGTVTDSQTGTGIAMFVNIYASNGNWITYAAEDGVGSYTTRGGLPTGTYFSRTNNNKGYLEELYDNLPCIFPYCDSTSGTPILVTGGSTTSGIDFVLDPGGVISGTITDSTTGVGVGNVEIGIYDSSGNMTASARTDISGNYSSGSGLPTGTYYARTINDIAYIDELYDNLPCKGWCNVRTGTPIAVTAGSTTTGIDFALEPGGAIAGRVTDSSTGLGINPALADFFDANGSHMASSGTDSSGNYKTNGLPAGTYYGFSINWSGHYDEIYENLSCTGWCNDVTIGSPITVTVGATTNGIDFALDPGGGNISGTVTDSVTGNPLQLYVQVYDSGGNWRTYGWPDSFGTYTTAGGLPSGGYYARSENWIGYLDEIYDNLPCVSGNCNPTTGTQIIVTAGATTMAIDFALQPTGSIFKDGFESGDISAWSSTVP